ncbi:MAG: peptide deformylase [Bacteroidia bacterium]|nr:peptide deformylase [Bacteroidia bacterium]
MILPIYAYGQPVLRKKAEEIDFNDPDLTKLISDMFDTMYDSNGIGLAAPQIGKSIRLFIVDGSEIEDIQPEGFKEVFINPTILEEFGTEWEFEEGCLSIPDVRANVKRKGELKIHYWDANFQEHTKSFDGMAARIIQHEYDHIEGILFTDRISPLKRSMLKRKMDGITRGITRADYKMKFYKR